MSLSLYFLSPVQLRRGVTERLWWAPGLQPGSTHHRHQRLGVKYVTAFMGFFHLFLVPDFGGEDFALIPEGCPPLSVPMDVVCWTSQGDPDICLLQKGHLPCLFGSRVDKILCPSMDVQDRLCKIGISCNATEGSNVSNPSFPLCLPLRLFAKDLLPPFHGGSAAGHTQFVLSLWSLGCSLCMRD